MAVPVHLIPSKFSIYCFSTEINEHEYKFDILKLKDSLMIFVNEKQRQQFEDLSYAVINEQAQYITSIQIFGNFLNEESRKLVHHLGKRLKKNIYLSLNVIGDYNLYMRIEQQLFEEIKNNVDKF